LVSGFFGLDRFWRKPDFLCGFFIFQIHIHPIIRPDPFLGWIGVDLTGSTGFAQSMYTLPAYIMHCSTNWIKLTVLIFACLSCVIDLFVKNIWLLNTFCSIVDCRYAFYTKKKRILNHNLINNIEIIKLATLYFYERSNIDIILPM
jgi:hypothetical protein